MEDTSWIVAVIGVLGGGAGIAALWTMRQTNRKLQAEAAAIVEEAAGRMVKRWEERVTKLEREMRKIKRELKAWIEVAEARAQQLREVDVTPCPDPPEQPEDAE